MMTLRMGLMRKSCFNSEMIPVLSIFTNNQNLSESVKYDFKNDFVGEQTIGGNLECKILKIFMMINPWFAKI